jgi:glycosyltransferase involved in cell wall biosynthesis
MRILYCNKYNYPFSGTEVYLFDLMRLMRDQGHDTALFAMANPYGTPTPQDRYFVPHLDFKDPRAGLLRRARLAAHAIYSQDARRRLGQLIQEFRPEVAHVRNIYHHLSPSILWELRKHKVPVIYHLNDFKLICPSYNLVARGAVCERCRGGQFWHVLRDGCYAGGRAASAVLAAEAYTHRWLRTYQRCVDRFVAPSQFVRDKLIEYGWDPGRIEVLPHFQRVESEAPPASAAHAPILYFGRLSAEKGVADLLQAMRHIPDVHLKIAGDGPCHLLIEAYERIETSVKLVLAGGASHTDAYAESLRQHASNRIRILDYVSGEVFEELLTNAMLFVLPSDLEGLSLALLEAMSAGICVLTSDIPENRELVDGVGFTFKPGDGAHLEQMLRRLIADPEARQQAGERAQQRVREQYLWPKIAEEIEAVYLQILNDKYPSAADAACGPPDPAQPRAA